MEKSDVISLISVTRTQNTRKQWVEEELPPREIFCTVESVTRAEWAAVGKNGLKPSVRATVWAEEYEGELTAEYGGQRYGVYRTYKPNQEEIELYLEKKGGV